MKGLWEKHYEGELSRLAYGETTTYYRGAMWLNTCASIEDWGCGLGYFKTCCMFPERVIGVDGSWSRFADKIVDLREYTSQVDGVFMRHVLEHNLEWRKVLKNALDSFTKRMCLIIFTPFNENGTIILGHNDMGNGSIPDQAFRYKELLEMMEPYVVQEETLKTKTQYGSEHVFYMEKS
jgi:hypothetical protein